MDPSSSAKKATSSVQDIADHKPPFGSRFLTDEADVWSQNAWDHVPPPEDQGETIAKSLSKQRSNPVPLEEKQTYNEKPAKHWDNFYKMNANNFFRNRKWLHNEFPELITATKADAGPMIITEVGCGAGNSVFPLLSANQNPYLHLHAYDYSSHAVKLVQSDPLYTSPLTGTIHASVWDVTSPNGPPADIALGTVDIVILVFVMSALHPDEWGRAVSNTVKMLKPGGVVLLRDYGRYDLTQLRFKGGRLLDENFYIRGDKTRVYFFDLDELSLLFTGSKVSPSLHTTTTTTEITSLSEDRDVDSLSLEADTATGALEFLGLGSKVKREESSPSGYHQEIQLDNLPPAQILDPDSHAVSAPATIANHTAVLSSTPTGPPLTTSSISPFQSQFQSYEPASSSSAINTIHTNLLSPEGLANCPSHPLFVTEQLGIDRRLIVNRKRQLKMYRVWMQGRFRKL